MAGDYPFCNGLKDKESHWLPAARDDFNLILRMYWPKPAVLQGVGKPPAVQAGK